MRKPVGICIQALAMVMNPAETAPLHKLGGAEWQKARRRAAQRIRDVAVELLDLYSRRAAREGTPLGVIASIADVSSATLGRLNAGRYSLEKLGRLHPSV